MDINVIEQFLNNLKNALEGPYSRKAVYDDLQSRKAMDTYSTIGSSGRQTYKLSEKKRAYEQTFSGWLDDLRSCLTFLKSQPSHSSLISKCNEFHQKVEQLRVVVRDF